MKNYDIDANILAGFIDESMEELEPLDTLFIELEENPEDLEPIGAIFRAIHSIKGSSAFFGLLKIKTLAHRMEDMLDKIRQKKVVVSKEATHVFLPALDMLRTMFTNVHEGKNETDNETEIERIVETIDDYCRKNESTRRHGIDKEDGELLGSLIFKLEEIRTHLPGDSSSLIDEAESIISHPMPRVVLPHQEEAIPPHEDEGATEDILEHGLERRNGRDRRRNADGSGDKTMRISEKDIDDFLSYVSELIVIEEMFSYLQKKLLSSQGKDIAVEFKRVIETFSALSGNLRDSILSVRKIPAKTVLQKAVRIAHDVAEKENKKVVTHIEGEDIRIDKSYIDMLDAPFTHMVTNAVSHGIETAAERTAAGKPIEGDLRITLQETKTGIELEIRDDGRGIDREALSRKATAIGLMDVNQSLTDEDIVDLMFMPGVSTAQNITEISGRGVGMDLAKKKVEDAGGRITVKSEIGCGSSFIVTLPKSISTQIMDGFLVRTGEDIYVLPMNLIGESFSLSPDHIETVEGKGEIVLRHGRVMPIIKLGDALARNNAAPPEKDLGGNHLKTNKTAISIVVSNRRQALMVDEIVGVQKVVVRAVEGITTDQPLFEGAAMLGDGRVAMIIGSDGLALIASG